jgi:hypothetical protein
VQDIVVVDVKTNGPERTHYAVEIGWWNLGTGDSGVFVPPHSAEHAKETGDLVTLGLIGYDLRLRDAPRDELDVEAHRLADALDGQILAAVDLLRVDQHLADTYRHVTMRTGRPAPSWTAAFDICSYAAGVMPVSIAEVEGLSWLCGLLGVDWFRGRTAAGDVHAAGECLLGLLAHQEERADVVAAGRSVFGGVRLDRRRRDRVAARRP